MRAAELGYTFVAAVEGVEIVDDGPPIIDNNPHFGRGIGDGNHVLDLIDSLFGSVADSDVLVCYRSIDLHDEEEV
jgi:hypothetical protein